MKTAIALVLVSVLPFAARAADEPIDYVRDIKPILAENCFACHGVDEQKSGLRLDSAAGIQAGGNAGPAIVPNKPAESLLLKALAGSGGIQRMPAESDPLAAEQIKLFEDWIAQGAQLPADEPTPAAARPTSDHWAFQPVHSPVLPNVKNSGWVRNPIDRFILARLEAEDIEPSQEADRATLIRRLSLDLTGLPPSVADVDTFLADARPDAYERLVDRLLDSPHYGERWGRIWLDLARYADSNGYTIDGSRSIWKYRDWVIQALNRDLPFDQFAIHQVAGDMLPHATIEEQIATGFHRNTLKNEEGGTDPEQFRVEAVVDRIETTGAVFLGLTLGCARCHDHKYDPISQREFYQVFALFNGADEPTLQVPTTQQAKELPALTTEIEQNDKRLADHDSTSGGRQVEWEKKLAGRLDVAWMPLVPLEVTSEQGASIQKLDDGSLLVSALRPANDAYTIVAELPPGPVTAVRLEVLTHDSLPSRGPGLTPHGNFVLNEVKLALLTPGTGAAGQPQQSPLAVATAVADHSQKDYPVLHAIDGKPKTGWAINVESGSLNVDRAAVFTIKDDVLAQQGTKLAVTLDQRHEGAGYLLGRFRLSVSSAERDATTLSAAGREVLIVPAEQRSDEQKQTALETFRAHDRDRIVLIERRNELAGRQSQLANAITETLVMQERPAARETFIHLRGDFLQPGARVPPNVPAVLPPFPTDVGRPTRLDFARWLVSPANPLTGRVTMNRLWQAYFGKGLVETENDFGTQGSEPTHPELLDWLADQLVERGYSLKAMHRLIVTSSAYRQSSLSRRDLDETDPYNKLLARQSRLRLEAEVVRDVALATGGLLSREIGGPGVYPPQPDGIYRFTQNVKYWTVSAGGDRYRRGLYIYFWRSSPYPFLATFDAPNANVSCTRRVRSNTPLQALTLANDAAFFEQAQSLASRVLFEAPGDEDSRIRYAFRLCMAREPAAHEAERLARFITAQRQDLAAAPDDAALLAPPNRPPDVDIVEAAAWTATARVLMNLDEFITRE